MAQRLDELLQRCTVKITVPGQSGWGTGFSVAPGLLLTCAHVVKALKPETPAQISWQHQEGIAEATVRSLIPELDLALLQFSSPQTIELPCVYLGDEFEPDDSFYTFGYPDNFPQGASVTGMCEGSAFEKGTALILFKLAQIRPGLSGSPLLNQRTGKVCGIVKFTRDRSSDLGGGAIPAHIILEQFPELRELQQAFHESDRCWSVLAANRFDLLGKVEEIRLMLQELKSGKRFRTDLVAENTEGFDNEVLFYKLSLDPITLEAINLRLDVIQEIYQAGYLPEPQKQELRRLNQQLQTFIHLDRDLQEITQEGDRLIQSAVEAMRLQLDALKLEGQELTDNVLSLQTKQEQDCQKQEAQIFQEFVDRLEASRAGSTWIGQNIETLVRCASRSVSQQLPDLSASEQEIDDFKFSLKQFLEQVSFCLYWGTYEILDAPDIPLVFSSIEPYQIAFQSMRESIPKRLNSGVIQEIEKCFDYLIERLPFY